MINNLQLTAFLLLIVATFTHIPHLHKHQIVQKIDTTEIMYGSTIRIKAGAFNFFLHSHLVNYPKGSGFQSVTGFPQDDDYNSLWTIKQANHQQVKTYYHQLHCGDTIRLEHALTKRNLHSQQLYQSMVTNGQEVSAFGQSGEGDDNDNWVITCLNKKEGAAFLGGDRFQLIHQETQKRLKMSRYYQYQWDNWQECPFQGQIQISAVDKKTRETEFKIVGGIFFRQSQKQSEGQQETKNSEEL